ncbi:MAG TPA: ABC transporter permease subunit [Ktedonobacteraceae bacterium]|nr:ABC transporter permease subunit [Ktedonobacteraceae bacterium]
MIWLSWRQHRLELLVIGIGLAFLAALLIQSGLVINAALHQLVKGDLSVASCVAHQNTSSFCQLIQAKFYDTYEDPNDLPIVLLVPVLIGMFLGAPLVARELERGTFRLIWTQSVTRLRWLLVKVGWQLAVILLLFALINQLVTWYLAQQWTGGDFGWNNFDMIGIVPLAYMVFALALGVAAGAITRHTIPAMIVTLIGYLGVRNLITSLRPNYLPPLSVTWDPYLYTAPKTLPGLVTQVPGGPGWDLFSLAGSQNWTLFSSYVDRAGHIPTASGFDTCITKYPPPGTTVIEDTFMRCAHAHGLVYRITWQPVDRLWLFQGIESAIFLGLAAGLLVLTYWWIRERIS